MNSTPIRLAGTSVLSVTCLLLLVAMGTTDDDFNPRVVINRRFPAIKNLAPKSRTEADQVLRDEELVLGVVVNGKARAYAINMLTGPTREIVNDELGGVAIAATW